MIVQRTLKKTVVILAARWSELGDFRGSGLASGQGDSWMLIGCGAGDGTGFAVEDDGLPSGFGEQNPSIWGAGDGRGTGWGNESCLGWSLAGA